MIVDYQPYDIIAVCVNALSQQTTACYHVFEARQTQSVDHVSTHGGDTNGLPANI